MSDPKHLISPTAGVLTLALLFTLTLPAGGQMAVSSFAGNAQHTAVYPVAAQSLNGVHWSTSVDLNNSGASMHYGAPVVSAANTVFVPVKTASGGFQVSAFNGSTGAAVYTLSTDYAMPAHNWIPGYSPAIVTTSSGTRLYYAGAGGTVYYIENPDSAPKAPPVQQAFYGMAGYRADAAAFNAGVFIDTPLTSDTQGNIFFGFRVQGPAPAPLSTAQSGFARIDPSGNAIYILAGTAAADSNIGRDSHNSAPALSNDESTLYVLVKGAATDSYGYLLGLDSLTLATKYKTALKDPRNGNYATISDDSTASPMTAPDNDVYIGVLGNPKDARRGFLLRFSADLTVQKTPGAFGGDDTPAVVPATMVPSYTGFSPYLIFSRYNDIPGDEGGQGVNRIALLDPNATQPDGYPSAGRLTVMREVLTVSGLTPDAHYVGAGFPLAVSEWSVNTPAVNPATGSIIVASEDGRVYRWDLRANALSQTIPLAPGGGQVNVPVVIGPDGTTYTIGGGRLFALGGVSGTDIGVTSTAAGQTLTFTASVRNTGTPGLTPTGTVTFQDRSFQGVTPLAITLDTVPVDAAGNASITTARLQPGSHFITATYSGSANLAGGSSTMVELVHAGGARGTLPKATVAHASTAGMLSGSADYSPNPANLTMEGNADWFHLGDSSLMRKATGGSQLSNVSVIGNTTVFGYMNDPRLLSWTDGTPDNAISNDPNGIYVSYAGNGFSFTAPADTNVRTLVVHAGGYFSVAKLTAHLSDSSAPDFVDITSALTSLYDRNYVLTYSAASAGQTLTVSWVEVTDLGAGNVDLNAAALSTFSGTIASVSGNPQSTVVGTAFSTVLQVSVTDASNRPVSGATVTFTAPATAPGVATGSFGSGATATAVTGASGIASAPTFTANGVAGSYYVTASVSGVPATAGFALTNAAGPPVSIAPVAGTPGSAVVNTTYTTALQAYVKDANNNPVSGATVTFAGPSTGAGVIFSGGGTTATAVTNASGVAFAPTIKANAQPGTYLVGATVGSGVTPAYYTLTNTTGGAGFLAGAGNNSSAAVNLTAIGGSDWIHWGDANLNRKATGGSQISNFGYASTLIPQNRTGSQGAQSVTKLHPENMGFEGYGNDTRLMSWTDGSPTVASSNNGDGYYIDYGTYITSGRNGFTFTAPADGTARTLSVYLGGTNSGGTLTAHLSDGSAPDFVDTTAINGSFYDRNYTLTYSAGSPGQTLTVTWAMSSGSGNVSLSAAALSVGVPSTISATAGTPQSTMVNSSFGTALQVTVLDANHNPITGVPVIFVGPAAGAGALFSGSTGTTATTNNSGVAIVSATADGVGGTYTVTATLAGAMAPATFTLTNVIGGGSLSGSGDNSGATANLTAEGALDWIHWGDAALNRKNGVTPQISNYTEVGSGPVPSYNNDPRTINWSDGTPTATGSNQDGVYIFGLQNGFSFTAPADGTRRTLTLHAGGWLTGGTLTAHLSDQSAADYVDTTPVANTQFDRNYTLIYNASSAGQTLTVTWVATSGNGNMTLNGAALSFTPPTVSTAAGTPQSAMVNTAFSTALQAIVLDANNNPLSGATVTFTASTGTGGAGASFGGSATATATSNASGIATAPALTANAQPGNYTVAATLAGVATPAIFSLSNFVGGGTLAGSGNSASSTANLTTEGTSDWVHWGDTASNPAALNRKNGVSAQLSSYTIIGSQPVMTYNNDARGLSWTDGTPTAASTANGDGLYLFYAQNGYSFSAPADSNTRTLTVHVGGWLSAATLTAHLSDSSAADFVDTTSLATSTYDRNYTLTYSAGAPGQTLTVTWVMNNGSGNITLNGAALTTLNNLTSQTISFGPLSGVNFGVAPFPVSATASSGLPVSFASTTIGVCTVAGSTVTIVAAGLCSIVASQAGNSTYAAAAPVTQSFSVTAATQTITFGALSNVTFGAAPFSLTATASSGLPVSFASTTTGVCTVAGATVTIVGAGSCSIAASQAGNTTYAAAASVTQTFTVSQASQTITFGPLGNVLYSSTPIALTATASSGLAVSLASTTTSVCTVAGTTVTLAGVGSCTITASQAGNANYTAAATVTQTFAVSQASQTITFASPGNVAIGSTAALGATASSGLPVSFASTTTAACTVAGASVTVVATGTCSITATQAGNANYTAASPVTQSFSVGGTLQTIAFGPLSGVVFGAAPFTITATASSGLAVSFASNTTSVCTVAGAVVTIAGGGTCSLTATQPGNGTYSAAPPVNQSFTVSQATQTITFAAPANAAVGSMTALSATASSGLPVSFTSTTVAVCTVAGATATPVAAGTCSITAGQAGNASYAAATPVVQSFSVGGASQTLAFGPLSGMVFGASPFTVTATASSGLAVSFTSNTTGICTVAGAVVTIVGAGTCSLTATQPGNGSYSAAAPVNQSFTVSQATQTITFAALASATVGSTATLSATASSGLPVSFTSTTTGVCTVAGASATLVAAGTCAITASQAGNANYTAASPVTQSFTISAASGGGGGGTGGGGTGGGGGGGGGSLGGSPLTASPTALTINVPVNGAPGKQTVTMSYQTYTQGAPTITCNTTTNQGFGWLSVSPSSQTMTQASYAGMLYTYQATVTASADPTGLAAGIADTGNLNCSANGGTASAGVTMNVSAQPAVYTMAPTSLTFNYRIGDPNVPAAQSISVFSKPSGAGFSASASGNSSWLTVGNAAGTTPQSIPVSVNVSGLAAGTFSGSVTIASGTAASVNIPVTLNVSKANPQLSVSPSLESLATLQGGAPVRGQVTISNAGSGTLQFTATSQSSWLSLSGGSGSATPTSPLALSYTADPSGLAAGVYTGQIMVSDANSGNQTVVNVVMAVTGTPSISVSKAGLLLTAVLGGAQTPSQSFTVFNPGNTTPNWSVQTLVVANPLASANWLAASTAGSTVTVSANAAGLPAGQYYGSVNVVPANAPASPQTVSVTLNVVASSASPGVTVSTGGVLLTGAAGSTGLAQQTVTVFNPSSTATAYTASAITSTGAAWLGVSPASGTLNPGSNALMVTADLSGLASGVQTGTLRLAFDSGSVATLQVVVVAENAAGSGGHFVAAKPARLEPWAARAACVAGQPAYLIPVFRLPGNQWQAQMASPVTVQAQVVDDCGGAVTAAKGGAVQVTFGNGDPGLDLHDVGNGIWEGTWVPAASGPAVALQISASEGSLRMDPTQVTGTSLTAAVQALSAGSPGQPTGVVNAASGGQAVPQVVAPGSYVAIYGQALSSGVGVSASSLPLPITLNGTQLLLGGKPMPLLFAGSGQVNALVPEGLAPNASYPLVVIRGATESVPVSLTVAELQPGIYTVDTSGSGAGIVTNSVTGQRINAANPAHAGDYLTVYCTGLGALQGPNGEMEPGDGAAAPSNLIFGTTAQVTATIGGVSVPAAFAGLTPTFAALYQVNVQVPTGVPTGNAVALTVTATDPQTGVTVRSNSVAIAVQ